MSFRKAARRIISSFLVVALIGSLFSSLVHASSDIGIGIEPPNPTQQEHNVQSAQFDTLTPSESKVTLALGEGAHDVTVEAKYKDGSIKDVTTQGAWTSSNPAVAVVADGKITAVAVGTAQVLLNLKDAVVNIAVKVTAAPEAETPEEAGADEPTFVAFFLTTLNLAVETDTIYPVKLRGTYSDGQTIDITDDAVWTSEDPTVATVRNGIIKGLKTGAATSIKVKYGDLPALSISVMVQKDRIINDMTESLRLTSNLLKLLVTDAPYKLYADLSFTDKDLFDITAFGRWYSSDEKVAKVDANGVVTPVGKGKAYIYFEYKVTAPVGTPGEEGYDDGLGIDAALVFVGGPIKLVRTDYQGFTVPLDEPVILHSRSYQETSIQGVYDEGLRGENTVDEITSDIEWTVEDKSIATIANYGRIYAGSKEGTTTIRGTYLDYKIEFKVTVSNAVKAPLLNLVAEPDHYTITDGKPVGLPTIKAIYSDGLVEDITDQLSESDWAISDPTVANLSGNGEVVAESAGSAILRGTYYGWPVYIPVIVKQADQRKSAALDVATAALDLQAGAEHQLQVEATLDDQTKLDKTQVSSYTSKDPQVAVVSDHGVVRAVGAGTTTIDVGYGGQSTSVTVNVAGTRASVLPEAPASITSLKVSEPDVMLEAGSGAHAVTVQAGYQDGTTADVTTKGAWTTKDASVVQVTDGVLTPVGPGSTSVQLALDGAIVIVRVAVRDGDVSSNVRIPDQSAEAADPTTVALLVSTTNVRIEKGEKFPVQLLAVKSDGTTADVSTAAAWSSFDPTIADVAEDDGEMNIVGVSTGSDYTEIPKRGKTTVSIAYDSFPTLELNVSVTEKQDELDLVATQFIDPQSEGSGIYASGDTIRLYDGQPYLLEPVAVDSEGGAVQDLGGAWSFDKPNVAKANPDGSLEGIAAGDVTATYTYVHYGITYQATLQLQVVDLQRIEADAAFVAEGHYKVEINPQLSSFIQLEEVYLDELSNEHKEDLDRFIQWTVGDDSIVGLLYDYNVPNDVRFIAGTTEGTTTVTGAYNGKTIQFDVTVTKNPIQPKLLKLSADPTYFILNKKEDEGTPVINGIYSDGTVTAMNNEDLQWQVGNPLIADFNEEGKLHGTYYKGGMVVNAIYQGEAERIPVIVTYSDAPPLTTSLDITPQLTALQVGQEKQLTATQTLSDSTTEDVTQYAYFQSKNPEVATVTNDGKVTGIRPGTAKITVFYNGFTERLNVEVSAGGSSGPIPADPGPAPAPEPEPTPTPTPEPSPAHPVVSKAVDAGAVKVKLEQALAEPAEVSYGDVSPSSWSSDAIKLATKIGFVKGYADGSFHPKASITRAEFASMLANALGLQAAADTATFADAEKHWALKSIQALKSYDFIDGYGDGTFRPNQPITRAEIVTILAKVIDFGQAARTSSFKDVDNHWAVKNIEAVAEAGVVKGRNDHTFAPNEQASREESVTLILRALSVSLGLHLEA
ncbi:S-layer homology domain-containing protein [Paenibacillus glycinis]|uniref:SLH domain-containing protein n=1 Tax=Paenibacillus glycinis TaxID=2697035 RepID=A0ABW9XKP3_9BACL|nr:S-layer homology domain-containing protein [Paenibacillus glycinis]NBD23022.1 hypothetical protein [Paenibacillus glycinis]